MYDDIEYVLDSIGIQHCEQQIILVKKKIEKKKRNRNCENQIECIDVGVRKTENGEHNMSNGRLSWGSFISLSVYG